MLIDAEMKMFPGFHTPVIFCKTSSPISSWDSA